MNGRTGALIAVVVILGIGLGAVIYLKSNIHSVTEATAPLFVGTVPVANPEGSPGSPGFPAPRQIQFSKEIVLREKSMSVDGGDFMPVACSIGSNEPAIFGFIQLNETQRADLTCAEEYMGGIGMTFIDPDGKQKTIKLVSSDGDAGDAWESRSWILKDNGIKIRSVNLSSSNDTETGELLNCTISKTYTAWDEKTHDFIPAQDPTEWSPSSFAPPIGVSKDCLNPDGTWKGK